VKLFLHQIPEEGLSSSVERDSAELDLDTNDVQIKSPVAIAYSVFLEQKELVAHLALQCRRGLVCARCLAPFEDDFSKEIDLAYPIAGATFVDLTDDIREEIVVDYPIKPLCQESCKGVCPECGQNLNEAVCGCERRTDGIT